MRKLLLGSLLFLNSMLVSAGGYQVNLVGIRYIGMGHIGTALKLDATSIFYNPGSLSLIEPKYSFTGGASGIFSYSAFQYQNSSYVARAENHVTTPFSIFGSAKITENLSAGIGIYTPYGSRLDWGKEWRGRYLIQEIELRTIFVQPTISYKLGDKVGIGAGLVYGNGSVSLSRALPVTDANGNEGSVALDGQTHTWGFNAGINLQATEKLNIGISYRSKLTMRVEDGEATFSAPASLASNFPTNNKFTASLPLPANLNVGLAYQCTEKFMLGLDFNYVFWSTYETLDFDFKENTSSLTDSKNPRNFNDGFVIRLGAEYKVLDVLSIRAGAYYDQAPSNDDYLTPETPDVNKVGLAAGLSVMPTKRLSVDASFLFIKGLAREAQYLPAGFAGTYKTNAFVPGLGLTYNF